MILSGIAISKKTFGGQTVIWAVSGYWGHSKDAVDANKDPLGESNDYAGAERHRYLSAYRESDGLFILGLNLATAITTDEGDWQSLSLGMIQSSFEHI